MIHAPNVVHETLDGETIVIHLDTGNYYSLTGSGPEIWGLVDGSSSTAKICAEVARRHGTVEDVVRDAVEGFVAELEREALVVPGQTSADGPSPPPDEDPAPWEPPKLERYGDLRHFLLVDPVHDVDETGWPARPAAQA